MKGSFRRRRKRNGMDFAPTMWPVGQVVKTAASHAVNIGSNPVRVTSFQQAAMSLLFAQAPKGLPMAAPLCGILIPRERANT